MRTTVKSNTLRWMTALALVMVSCGVYAVTYEKPQQKSAQSQESHYSSVVHSIVRLARDVNHLLFRSDPIAPQQIDIPVYHGRALRQDKGNAAAWDVPGYTFRSTSDGLGASGRFTRGKIHVTVGNEFRPTNTSHSSGTGANILGRSGEQTYQMTVVGGGAGLAAATANGNPSLRKANLNSGAVSVSLPALAVQRKNADALELATLNSRRGLRQTIGNPDEDDNDPVANGMPVGDAVLPLMLLALGYMLYIGRKRHGRAAMLWVTLLLAVGCAPKADKQAPDMTVRYSRTLIDARMSAWHNKDSQVGFPNANSTNGVVTPAQYATWDYVPGVVAKGILDTWAYYQDSAWADAWYTGLAEWADRFRDEQVEYEAGILDDLNCLKVYIGLYEGAKPGGRFENAERAAYYMEQLRQGAAALAAHKARYSIHIDTDASDGEVSYEPEVNGGWMHKATDDPAKSYWGQMWCDGAYMGQALLAQLLLTDACEGTGLGWNDVVKQFTASWPYLWDEEKQLPYHVLFTDVTTNRNGRAIMEAGHAYPCKPLPYEHPRQPIYHSEEYWCRAAGWYMMALVDALEAYMLHEGAAEGTLPEAADFETMHGYLQQLADGLVARQDPGTGCWYQLLQYDSTLCATQGVDDTGSARYTNVAEGGTQCNYLESSGSCLITAALLKGTRLGLLDHAEAGRKGYEGIIRQFVRHDSDGWNITHSCQSAGLSHDRNGSAAYYLIGKDVPIQDDTEGKAYGAFLMAATEYEKAYLTR